MIPKQNAKELIEAMAISVSYGYNYTGGDDIPIYRNQYAKECALIAVEEKIKLYNELNSLGLLLPNSVGFELVELKKQIQNFNQ